LTKYYLQFIIIGSYISGYEEVSIGNDAFQEGILEKRFLFKSQRCD